MNTNDEGKARAAAKKGGSVSTNVFLRAPRDALVHTLLWRDTQ